MMRFDREQTVTWGGAIVLMTVVATITAVALAVGDRGPERLQAIWGSAAVCLAGGLGGWLAGRIRPAQPSAAVGAGIAAICLRFFPALAALIWLQAAGGQFCEHGAAEWLLVFYLAVLATDILMHMIGARVSGTAKLKN